MLPGALWNTDYLDHFQLIPVQVRTCEKEGPPLCGSKDRRLTTSTCVWKRRARTGMKHLQSLVRRIDALISIRTQEMNRIDVSHESIRSSVKDHIAYPDQEIGNLKKQIAAYITNDPNLKMKRDLLKSIPGIGEATIAAILPALVSIQYNPVIRNV